ncbi:type II toxin-antitoxin system HigB family toxin [Acetobacter okinawensis]|uniref:type II toxin-antitoxin system HigB family toxin n=1 Tax=Acetobacter okinawensis TaxID=1076594 RepID=UPI002012C7E7|nr:type II toxin-antitoxin system HigB family toxin [Acetobacter okinawensis]
MAYKLLMRIISTKTLKDFYAQPTYTQAEMVIKTWIATTKAATWNTPIDVKSDFGQTDILKSGRAIFDLGGNKYRLVAWINYNFKTVYIRFIGTHAEYDKIDPETI